MNIQFEEEISRNPYFLKVWWNYLSFKEGAEPLERYIVYERALKFLPRSYKLWHAYLNERTKRLKSKSPSSKKVKILINTFERSLVYMHKMPRIWLDYCGFLVSIHRGTETRKAFDRALQALPITQHKDVWKLYIKWATNFGVPETAVRVYRRFLMYDSAYREDFVSYLEEIGQYEEAARQLSICLDDEHFVSPSGQTEHQLWMRLCDICAKHPEAVVNSIKVEPIIRSGIAKFSDEVGRLWNSLADYYIRLGQFDRARDVFEEAINSITTVRDFTIVFDAYVKVEESVLSTKIRFLQDVAEEGDASSEEGEDESADISLRLARIEFLLEKRPLLLNSVVLRQNPHNVHEWHKRAKLYKDDEQKTIVTYVEAIKTVDPLVAVGKLSGLWLALARFYEQHDNVSSARSILEKAVEVNYRTVDELANVWCAWGEMEMRLERYDKALDVMQQAVAEPIASARRRRAQVAALGQGNEQYEDSFEGSVTADRLYKNKKVWSLYLDLEESLGSVESCRAAYDRAMDLKVITAQMALNYASFLEEHQFFEDSFRVYERAVILFAFPQVKQIWLQYLEKFIARYGGSKMERLRDLFEQAVAQVPAESAAEFYLKYANAEEQYGLARHAMAVYDRATRAVPESTQLDMYRLYIKKVEQFVGVMKTRPIYERATQELPDDMSKEMCLEFAEMERNLGEVDRARAVLQFGSQFANPSRDQRYWQHWREFEENHGNEDTFRDMLRVQRSVETAFSHYNYTAADMLAGQAFTAASANTTPSVVATNPATTLASDKLAPALSGMDALAHNAEQRAMQQITTESSDNSSDCAVLGQKRKFVTTATNSDGNFGNASNGGDSRASKEQRKDEDEIDI